MSSGPFPCSTLKPTSTSIWRPSKMSRPRSPRPSRSGPRKLQSTRNHVGTAALGCPAERSSADRAKENDLPAKENEVNLPHLKRVLGRWDLVLLFVVAVVNLNVVPTI